MQAKELDDDDEEMVDCSGYDPGLDPEDDKV